MDGMKVPLGSVRVTPLGHAASLSHLDVSTQADIVHLATTYDSEDENMGRRRSPRSPAPRRPAAPPTTYSKQEFREQYCITSKQLDLFELERSRKERFFGCLSHYNIESPCSRAGSRSSLLSVCVRRRVPSDENLNSDYAPIQRYPRDMMVSKDTQRPEVHHLPLPLCRYPPPMPPPDELRQYDEDLECSYFRRRPKSVCGQPDPKRYTWMPEDEDATRMERPRSIRAEDDLGRPASRQSSMSNQSGMQYMSYSSEYLATPTPQHRHYQCPAHPELPPPPPPPAILPEGAPHNRTKHVSFARSHTLTSFSDATSVGTSSIRRSARGGERLLDGRIRPLDPSAPGGQPPQQQQQQNLVPLQQMPPIQMQPMQQGFQQQFGQPMSMAHFPSAQIFSVNGPVPVHGQLHPALLTAHFPAAHLVSMQSQHHVPQQAQVPAQTSKVVVLEKLKRGPMKTQATQTEVCLGRKPLPPNYLSLSPRTVKRVKMVAQGVQTNGGLNGANGKKLLKSFSEATAGAASAAGVGARPLPSHYQQQTQYSFSESGGSEMEHDRLQRTQSEEPRSPRSIATPPETTPRKQVTLVEQPAIMQYTPLTPTSSCSVPIGSRQTTPTNTLLRRQSTPNIEQSVMQREQGQEYFQQNFQFIHAMDDKDDTIDEQSLVQDMQMIQQSMELNQKNLDYLQQKIAAQQMQKTEYSTPVKSLPSLPVSVANVAVSQVQKFVNSGQLSKTSTLQSEASTETSGTTTTTTTDTEKLEKEIFIDFEPQINADSPLVLRRSRKRMLQKTLSEGEILYERRRHEVMRSTLDGDVVKDAPLVMSTSHENVKISSDIDFGNEYDYYQHTPIKDEDIFKQPIGANGIFGPGRLTGQESLDEEFHENYVCGKKGMFRKRSISLEEGSSAGCSSDPQEMGVSDNRVLPKSTPTSPQSDLEKGHNQLKRSKKELSSPDEGDSVVPTSCLIPDQKISPFASSDSLTIDLTRDHSDGIWNESQATVLQVDSGTENGTVVSTSDMSSLAASPGSLSLLTPNSRRKLLLQHQQRSSMDTDALDEELDYAQSQSPSSPRMKLESSPLGQSSSTKQILLSPMTAKQSSLLPVTRQPGSTPTPAIAITQCGEPVQERSRPAEGIQDRSRAIGSVTKRRERALSPARRKDLQRNKDTPDLTPSHTPHRSLDSPSTGGRGHAVVPDLLLARTDSGRTNTTDVSESTTTTTTDTDYVTANSDSSKRSIDKAVGQVTEAKNHEGSSFESASSLYSLARVEALAEDMVVPCISPPPPTHTLSRAPVPIPSITSPVQNSGTPSPGKARDKHKKRPSSASPSHTKSPGKDPPSPSGSSSSSGSYSLGLSAPDLSGKRSSKGTSSKGHSSSSKAGQTSTSKGQMAAAKGLNSSVKGQSSVTKMATDQVPEISARPPMASPPGEQTVPTMKGESVSEDERSGHYSSSGYYESPIDDEDDDGGLTYRYSQKYKNSNRPWTADERRKKRKTFTLDFTKHVDDSISPSQENWPRRSSMIAENISLARSPMSHEKSLEEKPTPSIFIKKSPSFPEKSKLSSSPKSHADLERSLRDRDFESKRIADRERFVKKKAKSRSPVQSKGKDMMTPVHSRGQGLLMETLRRQDMVSKNGKVQLNVLTSDDSSEQYRAEASATNGSVSPRRHRRPRESPRRKNGNLLNTKSPIATFNTGVSSHSLPRRRSSIQPTKIISSLEAEDIETSLTSAGYRLSPLNYIKAPAEGQPRQRIHKKGSPDSKPKAMSAESLRSVSPGSDSVFYSEAGELISAGSAGAAGVSGASVHCHHCGKQVDIVTAEDASSPHCQGGYVEDPQPDIVQPPAGFADSPNGVRPLARLPGGRLYKKMEKRFRSEERQHVERRHHHRYRQDVRAKSEERGTDDHEQLKSTRPLARSTGTSLDKLRAAESSPNMEDDAEDPESDYGIYAESYRGGVWIYIGDSEEVAAWQRPDKDDDRSQEDDDKQERRDSTESEHEFRKKYQAVTHRMVHRKSCIEMYKRQSSNTFESDKTVIVRRHSGEFGFRIHGSKPVVVSAIEPDTPAETSGLEVGDIVIAVNGINVLDKSHSEVVKIAHAGSDTLELEVARTCDAVGSLAGDGATPALYSGFLWKQAGHASGQQTVPAAWARRWFCLKRDNCLYYYKNDTEPQPVGALMLMDYCVVRVTDPGTRAHTFRLQRVTRACPGQAPGPPTCPPLVLAADTEEAATRWLAVISHAIEKSKQRDGWLDSTIRNMKVSPSQVARPDCFGYLMKLGNKWKAWTKRYCVLKDACLYFYQDGNSKSAFGMACLHGYRVQQSNTGGKKHAFEVMPPETKQRHFYFHTESEMDKKRWVAALEYSIDRWMKAG